MIFTNLMLILSTPRTLKKWTNLSKEGTHHSNLDTNTMKFKFYRPTGIRVKGDSLFGLLYVSSIKKKFPLEIS